MVPKGTPGALEELGWKSQAGAEALEMGKTPGQAASCGRSVGRATYTRDKPKEYGSRSRDAPDQMATPRSLVMLLASARGVVPWGY